MTVIDVAHWVGRAQHHRENDGGYTFESLAVEMVAQLGWPLSWSVAERIDDIWRYQDNAATRTDAHRAGDALYEFLGWEQAVLFSAWFRRLDNYRMVRDEFPNGGGIAPYRGGA